MGGASKAVPACTEFTRLADPTSRLSKKGDVADANVSGKVTSHCYQAGCPHEASASHHTTYNSKALAYCADRFCVTVSFHPGVRPQGQGEV